MNGKLCRQIIITHSRIHRYIYHIYPRQFCRRNTKKKTIEKITLIQIIMQSANRTILQIHTRSPACIHAHRHVPTHTYTNSAAHACLQWSDRKIPSLINCIHDLHTFLSLLVLTIDVIVRCYVLKKNLWVMNFSRSA